MVEAANRVALSVEIDHNIITDTHEYIHRYDSLYESEYDSLLFRKNIRIRGLPELADRAVVDMFRELCNKKLRKYSHES